MHHRLRDLGPDARDNAIGPHEASGRDRFEKVLRDERIDCRHAGDVDDREIGALVDDRL